MRNQDNEAGFKKLQHDFPALKQVTSYQPVLWLNDSLTEADRAFKNLTYKHPQLNEESIKDAEARLQRFAPLIALLFPETRESGGIIESETAEVPEMKQLLEQYYRQSLPGRLFLKCDSHLPVAGSVKARGGIYEVLKHAETLALKEGLLKTGDDYSVLAKPSIKDFFRCHILAVGSTGNLGLSIGITGAALGFKTMVHLSRDARAWKKELLRSHGVEVLEYDSDYSKAVEAGRRQSSSDPRSYFIDDENSL